MEDAEAHSASLTNVETEVHCSVRENTSDWDCCVETAGQKDFTLSDPKSCEMLVHAPWDSNHWSISSEKVGPPRYCDFMAAPGVKCPRYLDLKN